MTTIIYTSKYGDVEVRNSMLETDNNEIVDGIEIKFDGHLIEVYDWYDLDDMTESKLVQLIDKYGEYL
jgi:hypothetical protein